jgi:hypothetical protein
MADLVKVGQAETSGRDLFLIEAAGPGDVPAVLALPCPYFACLLAWDATAVPDAEVAALARRLLLAGCVYVCCWGPGCERVHDLFDLAALDLGPDGPFCMSSWHAGVPLAEALWIRLFCSWPGDAYFGGCRAAVAVAIGSMEWAAEVRTALSSPGEFSARLLASEPRPA